MDRRIKEAVNADLTAKGWTQVHVLNDDRCAPGACQIEACGSEAHIT